MGIEIVRTSSHLPGKTVGNDYFEEILDTSDKWIRTRTGIVNRNFAQDESLLDMVERVVLKLELDEMEKKKIKKIIVATCTATSTIPSLASQLQGRLGLEEDIYALDINMACSGYVAGLALLEDMLKEDEYALLIGAELFSPILDFEDRGSCILFGDGAGANLIKYSENQGIFKSGLISDLDSLNFGYTRDSLYMEGREVYKFAINKISKEVENFLAVNDINVEDIDLFFFHQANKRILDYLRKHLGIDEDKLPINLQDVGNISAASIPVLLDEYHRENPIEKGSKILFLGFGAGLTWSMGLMKW